jgi:hypothetical protein
MGSRGTSTTAMPGCRYGGQAAPPNAVLNSERHRQDACATLGAGTPNIEHSTPTCVASRHSTPKADRQDACATLEAGKIEFQLSCEQHQTPDRERGRGRGRIRKQGPAEAGTPNIEHSTSNSRTRTSRLRCTTPRQGTRRKGNAQLRMETGRMPVLLWKLAEAGTPNIEHRTSNIGHAEAWTPNAQPSTLPPPARPRSKAGNPQPT